jgi:enamine deaminase RidA (YjgF/YER057c/UK114 family)
MKITTVHPRTPEYSMPFVPAMLVEGARYLFVAGCGPVPLYHKHPHDPELERASFDGGIREQTRRTFENIKLVLKAAGATLNNVVRVLIFITDPALQDDFNEVYQKEFGTHLPPRTFVTVPALVHKEMLVEIEVTAALPANPGGPAASRTHQGGQDARNRRAAAARKASRRAVKKR